jgi:small conductance mechanosensitive channel
MQEMLDTAEEFFAVPIIGATGRILLALIVAAILVQLINVSSRRLEAYMRRRSDLLPSDGQKRLQTVQNAFRYLAFVLIGLVVVTVILRELGIDLGPLFAGAGIAGIVIGFGAQNLVRDFFTGIFVMLENQYRVGDWIQIGNASGAVTKVTLRITRLRDGDGNQHIIPNGQITQVTNFTKEWARAVLDVGVSYSENVDRVMEVLEDVGREIAEDPDFAPFITSPLQVMGVQDLGESAVVIRIRFSTDPDQRWAVQREMRRRIKNRFDAEGIEIPFPHRKIYMGQAHENPAPPEPESKGE